MNGTPGRWIALAIAALYASGNTLFAFYLVAQMDQQPSDSRFTQELRGLFVVAVFLFVFLPAMLAWCGIIGSLGGSRMAFLLVMVPAIGTSVAGSVLVAIAAQHAMLPVAIAAVAVCLGAVGTAPLLRARPAAAESRE